MKKKDIINIKTVPKNVRLKTPRCRKLGRSLEMQNDDLMHREGLNG